MKQEGMKENCSNSIKIFKCVFKINFKYDNEQN